MDSLRNLGVKCVRRALYVEFCKPLQKIFTSKLQVCRIHQCGSFNKNEDFGEKGNIDRLSKQTSSAISSKYQIFRDMDATVILDVEEERLKHLETLAPSLEQEKEDEFYGLNLDRGIHGVYDIEELVFLLKREKLQDIFVASLPTEMNYVDYIVVVTGKSLRHMVAVAEFVRKVYKRKKQPHDLIPKIEGANSKDWIALDLGNIALHIFSRNARCIYDLESLWSVGPQYDLAHNEPDDPFITLLQQHSVYLGDLQPAEDVSENKNL